MKMLKVIILLILSITSSLYSQLAISMSADKDTYEYGEVIELECRITNTADTTFQFLAGTYRTCQAEFSFNDFESWEYEACLTLSELLIFEPFTSKVYTWIIDPYVYGLPNKEGTQQILGSYYFDLVDTITIQAEQFLGGQVEVGYFKSDSATVNTIFDSLNAEVIHHEEGLDQISEVWQIIGHQIDSVNNKYNKDTIFTYFEKNIFVEYESIKNENPLDFYPLQIGNHWQYSENGVVVMESRAVIDTTMPNSRTYTKISGSFSGYYRKDGSKVYSYSPATNVEKLKYDFSLDEGDTLSIETYDQDTLIIWVSSIGYTEIFGETRKYLAYRYEWLNFSEDVEKVFIDGIGFSQHAGGMLFYGLTGAVIDGKQYGTIVSVDKSNETLPTEYSLTQNYPNPFNPTTKISYSIPSQSHVSLKIFDVLGREVVTLVKKEQPSGNYDVDFDASGLTSGIYFYRIQSGQFVESKKMVLLK